jgi:hypothetical protein
LQRYERWLFAYASVHTRWQENVRLFEALKSVFWFHHRIEVWNTVKKARCGMYTVRTKGVWGLQNLFWDDPKWFRPLAGEPLWECRDRLVKVLHGLGIAKVSFALEMVYPESCGVLCVDTHIAQLYGMTGPTMRDKDYRSAERHWLDLCAERQLPSPMVRHIYWDRLRKESSTRYWSYCLEEKKRA